MRYGNRTRVTTQVRTWLPPSGFSPLLLSPFLWLDASDPSTITTSGSSVSQWNDKSGNARNVTQATAASQPTLLTSAQNGLNTIQFDGSNDWLARAATGFPTTGSRHMFAAVKYTGSASGYQHIAIWGNSTDTLNSSWGLVTSRISTSYYGRVHIWANPSNSPLTTQTLATNTWHEINASYNGASTTIYANGTQGETKSVTLTTLVNQNFVVGARTFSPAEYWTGEIGEIILYDYVLSTQQRQDIESYLKLKWGI
jgi:hypothetical protein